MGPKRIRKIALYLEYIAIVMRRDAEEMEKNENDRKKRLANRCKRKAKVPGA